MTNTFTEARYPGEFLLSEAPGNYSRDTVQIEDGQTILSGTLLGIVGYTGAQTVAAAVAFSGNTGTGTVGSLTADANAMPGDYKIVIIEPAANAGTFIVEKPNGAIDGRGTVAVAYNGSINFTLSDATDFISGDGFTVNVAYASGVPKCKAFDPAGTDGSQTPVAVALYPVTTSGATAKIAAIRRAADINLNLISWPTATDAQKAAALASLAAPSVGIRVR